MNNELNKQKLLDFVRTKWKPLSLGGLVIVGLVITLLIPSGRRAAQLPPRANTNSSSGGKSNNSPPSKSPFNLFGIFGKSQNKDQPDTKKQEEISLKNINSGSLSAPIPSTITKIAANGTKTTQPLSSGSIVNTQQGSINPNANIQTGVESSTQPDDIRIIFQNPDGTTFTYIPPGTPPGEVRWGRYTNTKSKYAINYPVNWQFIYSIDAEGFEGVTLFPPGVDPLGTESPYIFFTFSTAPFNLADLNLSDAYSTPLTADGIKGALYTNGPLGQSYITSILDYKDGKFALSASKSDATFAYVYYYMLHSVTFNFE